MRNGAHCPNSGGRTMVGNSCDRVCVRSMTRISPLATARANAFRSTVIRHPSACHFALERLWVDRKALPDVLGDVAHEYVLDPTLERANHGVGERRRRHLRRRHDLE